MQKSPANNLKSVSLSRVQNDSFDEPEIDLTIDEWLTTNPSVDIVEMKFTTVVLSDDKILHTVVLLYY